jgi:hypothetical protein
VKRGLSRHDPYAEDVRQEIERRNIEEKETTFLEKAKELLTKKMKFFTRR